MEIKFKYFSISINAEEVEILNKLIDDQWAVAYFSIDDWSVIDLLYKKHIIIYDKTRETKPEIQPWCRNIVLRTLSKDQSGD